MRIAAYGKQCKVTDADETLFTGTKEACEWWLSGLLAGLIGKCVITCYGNRVMVEAFISEKGVFQVRDSKGALRELTYSELHGEIEVKTQFEVVVRGEFRSERRYGKARLETTANEQVANCLASLQKLGDMVGQVEVMSVSTKVVEEKPS